MGGMGVGDGRNDQTVNESDRNGSKWSWGVIRAFLKFHRNRLRYGKMILGVSNSGAYHIGLSSQHSGVGRHKYLIYKLPIVT